MHGVVHGSVVSGGCDDQGSSRSRIRREIMGVDGGPGKGHLISRFFRCDGQCLLRRDHGHWTIPSQMLKIISVKSLLKWYRLIIYTSTPLSPLAGIHSLTAETRFLLNFRKKSGILKKCCFPLLHNDIVISASFAPKDSRFLLILTAGYAFLFRFGQFS